MKRSHLLLLVFILVILLSACKPTPMQAPAQITETQAPPAVEPEASEALPEDPTPTPEPPTPTPISASSWSTSASTKTELSFAFPGNWDGSSPLTFGEGEFVKDPDLPLGATFQIALAGDPETLLNTWGDKEIGIIGIVSFTPETITDGQPVTISRVETPTKIATGNNITAQVAYLQRAEDTLEVMWFAPSDQWDAMQETFALLLENIELWRRFSQVELGISTVYPHDWQPPELLETEPGLWFRSQDEATGLHLMIINEIVDPVQLLADWQVDALAVLGFDQCTAENSDRMRTMSGQWESIMGNCKNAAGVETTYEITFVPNKDRVIQIITYAPTETWEEANNIAFNHLLGLMIDTRQ